MLDDTDRKILTILMQNGRITWADLSAQIGMSAPSTVERVKKLQESGVIEGYAGLVSPRALGLGMLAFVFVSMTAAGDHDEFHRAMMAKDEILECHVVAGEYDFLLKVRCRDGEHLKELLREDIRGLPSVAATNATIALSTIKESTLLPL